jgi:hypothetical protein
MMAQAESMGIQIQRPPTVDTSNEPSLWASQSVSVGDGDVTGVALVLREGRSYQWSRVVRRGGQAAEGAAALSRISITLEPAAVSYSSASPCRAPTLPPKRRFK